MTRGSLCPTELELDRLFVGELDAARAERGRAHAASCARCAALVAERERGVAAFAQDVGLDHVTAATLRRLRAERTTRAVMVAAGALAAAVVIYLALPKRHDPGTPEHPVAAALPGPTEPSGVRIKGGLALELVAKRLDGHTEWLASPAQLAPSEAIRFAISTPSPGFVAIVGVDAAATVSAYVPAGAGPGVRLGAGRQQLLDGSIVLDDTLGAERIFAVRCDDAIDVADVVASARAALRRAGHPARIELLALPAACAQTSFLIEKHADSRGAP